MVLLDAHTVDPHTLVEADVCIVGAGAAGIALARELMANRHSQVVVLESGGMQPDPATQALCDVDTVGHPLRIDQGYVSRNRYFGGSTNTWGGRCIPLNAIDFEARDWVADSGWPFDRSVLEGFYRQAAKVLKLPAYHYFSPDAWQKKRLGAQFQALDHDGLAPEVALMGTSPLKMGRVYRQALATASNVRVYLQANVTELEPNLDSTAVEHVHVATLAGHHFQVRARVYVLACGGWENARLLLASSRYSPQGLGNPYDVVGRYYMEHPKIWLGRIYPRTNLLRWPAVLDYARIPGGYGQIGLRLTNTQQRESQVLNHYLQLVSGFPAGLPEARQTWQWVCSHAKRLRLNQIRPQDLRQVAPHLGQIGEYFLCRTFNWPVPYPYIDILNHFEQAPNRDSRVSLGQDRDALGNRRLQVDLRITRQEKESLVTLHRLVGERLARLGLGELVTPELDPDASWPGLTDSSHHMGTTRMGLNPHRSVVDPNGLVHGVSNLYITGSSVFPTGGHANPTLTLVALALRLADHLQTAVLPALDHAVLSGQTAYSSSSVAPSALD